MKRTGTFADTLMETTTTFSSFCRRADGHYPNHVMVLANRFRYPKHSLLFGRARLFGDRIELTGWDRHGRHHRCIPLGLVMSLDYHPLQERANLTLHLATGDVLPLHIDEAHRWREMYENWLRYAILPSAKLLDAPQAADLAG